MSRQFPAAYSTDANLHFCLPSSSLSRRDHQPLLLAILRFPLSFRDVEEMFAMRGVSFSYETIRECPVSSVGPTTTACVADLLAPATDDLDEVILKINGRTHHLWRAVDQDGDVLDILVQTSRDKKAAKKFFASC